MPILPLSKLICSQKRVFLRIDGNVSIKNGVIQDDYRLKMLIPTLEYLRSCSRVIIASHRGNPDPQAPDPELSMCHLQPWFQHHRFPVTFASNPTEAAKLLTSQSAPPWILLENLRFFEGEKSHDCSFTKSLASLADVYVNDAFGTIHRTDSSITLLAQQFSPHNRGIGFLVEREMATLDSLKNQPAQPFMLVLGGAKLDDKIPLIKHMLSKFSSQCPQKILIGGALSLPFLKAQGFETGSFRLDPQTITMASLVLKTASEKGVEVILPVDFVVTNPAEASDTIKSSQIPTGASCMDIGPETQNLFTKYIAQAATLFTNGTMGLYETPAYQTGTKAILQAIAHNPGNTIAGGGDCVTAIHAFKLQDSLRFLSTGGGATLAYLAAEDPQQDLPGLQAL